MTSSNQISVFDRVLLRERLNRTLPNRAGGDVLAMESAQLLLDRLGDVKRSFASILIIGDQSDLIAANLPKSDTLIVRAHLSERQMHEGQGLRVVCDEEFLPFGKHSFDLILCNLNLHWVNDLPGTLAQIRYMLKPEGLFLATMLGGQTLVELRHCLTDAEIEVSGGISPRLSPLADLYALSHLSQRAGFSLPVVDNESLTFTYPDLYALMRDLRGMGLTNAHRDRLKAFTCRTLFAKADALYRERYSLPDRQIPATFDILHLHAWG